MRRRSVVRAQVNKYVIDADDSAEAADIDGDAKPGRFPRICCGARILEDCAQHYTAVANDFLDPEASEGIRRSAGLCAIRFMHLEWRAILRQQVDDPSIESSRAGKATERLCETAGRAVFAVVISACVLDVLHGFDYVAQAVVEGRGSGGKVFLITTAAHF